MEYIINKVDKLKDENGVENGIIKVNIDITMPEGYFNETIAQAELGILKQITEELT
jgi:hypothetical protein